MPNRSATIVASFLVALAAGIAWWALSRAAPEGAPSLPAASSPGASTQSSRPFFAPVAPSQPAPTAAKPRAAWREMQEKFSRATSLRAFFYEAIRRPQDGGYDLAFQVLYNCEVPETTAAVSERHREAIQAWRSRCDFTEQDSQDARRQLEASRNFNLLDDPLLARTFDFLQATTPDAKVAVLSAAIDDGNPALIASLASPSMHAAAPPWQGYVGALLACRLGADCGRDAWATLRMCVTRGWCADSLPDALRTGLGADYARLDQATARLTDALRRRDLARVLQPR